MGVNISGLVSSEPRRLGDFRGRSIAIDAYNAIYQFLSIIRQPDGTPLMDSQGRITSHLSGLIYRNANLLEAGIRPVYVFDGEPNPLKREVIESRQEARRQARIEWEQALREGDIERARTKAQQTSRLSDEIVENSKQLLKALGIPFVDALGEGEAQAAHMAKRGDVWAAASQDFDSLLFGSPYLVRNLTVTGRRKLPRKRVYVEVEPELVSLETILDTLGLTITQLVDVGILVGTDYNEGVKGVGPKKALALITKYGTLERVLEEKQIEIPHFDEIREIFLKPVVTDSYSIEWREPDHDRVIEILCETHDFSRDRVTKALARIESSKKAREQKTLEQWF